MSSGVHPEPEGPPLPGRIRGNYYDGMTGTSGAILLRSCQLSFAVISFCVMAATSDFTSVMAFRYLLAAVGLQSLWSLSSGLLDTYAFSVNRNFNNLIIVILFTFADGITSTLTFSAASASAGITVLISKDLGKCNVNNCARFMAATAMAFLSWFAASRSFSLSFFRLVKP